MTDNGILPRVPGEYVGAAINTLPAPTSTSDAVMETEIDVPGIGRVRFTAKRNESNRGRSRNYFWTATKAVIVE